MKNRHCMLRMATAILSPRSGVSIVDGFCTSRQQRVDSFSKGKTSALRILPSNTISRRATRYSNDLDSESIVDSEIADSVRDGAMASSVVQKEKLDAIVLDAN